MTKKEAIALEALCEKYLREALGIDVTVSMNLLGRLKFIFYNGDYIVISKDFYDTTYVRYTGDFEELMDTCSRIKNCVLNHATDFAALVWSYNNQGLLEE